MEEHQNRYSLTPRLLFSRRTAASTRSQALSKQLDERMEELRQEFYARERLHNSVSLPNTIPPELLARIFLALIDDLNGDRTSDFPSNDLSWLAVTRVCQHWRTVAVGCAALWSDLPFEKTPALTKLFLERSKNAPLAIIFPRSRTLHHYTIMHEALCQPERLHVVDLILDDGADSIDLSGPLAAIKASAPYLEMFKLYDRRQGNLATRLPDDFKMGGAPCLKVLNLRNIGARWEGLPLGSTLTTLRLQLDSFGTPMATTGVIVKSLSQMPCLTDLELSRCIQSGVTPTTTRKPLFLPRLQRLSLTDPVTAIEEFLSLVRFSKSGEVKLVFTEMDVVEDRLDQCFATLKTCWNNDDAVACQKRGIKSLRVSVSGAAIRGSSLFEMTFSDGPFEDEDDEGPTLRIALRRPVSFTSTILEPLDHQFGLVPLSKLLMEAHGDNYAFSRRFFERNFMHLPKLSTISFSGLPIREFLFVMGDDLAANSSPSGGPSASTVPAIPSFPGLTEIELWDVDFGRGSERVVSLLIRTLASRRQGYRIKRLSIVHASNFEDVDDKAIRQAAPDLQYTWDKHVHCPAYIP